ncbi:MAG: lipocalin family protein [Dysgonomonas sp.]|nr:lipocalin family protein [Dysgonomonas sp.]
MNFSKIFIYLFAAILLALPSCSDDDDDDKSLKGTTWEHYNDDDGIVYKSTITFSKNTFTTSWSETYDGKEDDGSDEGTYTYDHPKVTLIYDYENGEQETETYTISDNKMIRDDNGENGESFYYTKK